MAYDEWATLDVIYDTMFRAGSWGAGTTSLSFSFPETVPDDYETILGKPKNEGTDFMAFTLTQRLWARHAIGFWDDVIDLDFVDLAGGEGGDIRFMNTDTSDVSDWGYAKDISGDLRGDIWINRENLATWVPEYGNFAYATLLHEFGHALGLQHPGDYNADDPGGANYEDDAPYSQDTHQFTIMSYFGAGNTGGSHPANYVAPMLHDIYVAQLEYGAEMSTRTGDTTYGYNSTADSIIYDLDVYETPVYAIWDAGGEDTLDLSGSDEDVRLDLRAGYFSSFAGGTDNVAIAYGVDIENAIGGTGDDWLWGNSLGNELTGNDGGDSLNGQGGNDTLVGGEGEDILRGSIGNDTLDGGEGDDSLDGNIGHDTFIGGPGLDRVSFEYSSASWTIDLLAGTANDGGGIEDLDGIEGVAMGDGDDSVSGSYAFNDIETGEGDDVVYRRGDTEGNLLDGGKGIDLLDLSLGEIGLSVDLHNSFSTQLVVDLPGTLNDVYERFMGFENLVGTPFDDHLQAAYAFDNFIDGGAGDDVINGSGGDNTLVGGAGDDTILTGAGDEIIDGGANFDTLSFILADGGVTADLLLDTGNGLGIGNDVDWISIEGLSGTPEGDTLYGDNNNNSLAGLEGNDILIGRGGKDTAYGADGVDYIFTDFGDLGLVDDIERRKPGQHDCDPVIPRVRHEQPGAADYAAGEAGNDVIAGGDGDDELHGGIDNDFIDGGDDADEIHGGSGDDTLAGGEGDDSLFGGAGFDIADYRGSPDKIAINLNQILQPETGDGADQLHGIEGVFGSAQDDELLAAANTAAALYGCDGSDLLTGSILGDTLWGGESNDVIRDAHGDDEINGGAGIDTVDYSIASGGILLDLNVVAQATGGAGNDALTSVENIIATDLDDFIIGNASANSLGGGESNDTLFGLDGNDRLIGGAGDDLLRGGNDSDVIDGGAGNDTASYVNAAAGISIDLDIALSQFTGGSGWDDLDSIENLIGSAHDDALSGDGGSNVLSGGGGSDNLGGAEGSDVLQGGAGIDVLFGGAGEDTLDGGVNPAASGDFMYGGLDDDTYLVDSGFDLVDEGILFPSLASGGTDTIISFADFFWDVHSAAEILQVAEAVDDAGGDGVTIVGSVFDSTLGGHSGTDIAFGRGGSDTYRLGDGVDWMSLSTLGLTDENAYEGVDGVNAVVAEQRESGDFSYDIIFEFETGKDRIDVSDYAEANALTTGADVLARAVDDGAGSSYIALGDGFDYVYLVGLEVADLSAGDFLVA